MNFHFIANFIAEFLALLFGSCAILHFAAPGFLSASYRRWDFAPGFYYLTGLLQAFAAVFLAVPQTRIWGGILAAVILFVVVVLLFNRRKYLYAIPLVLLMIALAPAMA